MDRCSAGSHLCQNRHAWTSGEFVKNLLFFGLDIHVLELRGHGKSSIDLQYQRAAKFNRKVPPDLDWEWDIDSYFLYDLPAAFAGVRRITRRERIFFCGHSMGGMLGYGYAGIHPDHFEGIVTIGAAAELGRGSVLLKTLGYLGPGVAASVDSVLSGLNVQRGISHLASSVVSKLRRKERPTPPVPLKYRYLPLDTWLKLAADALGYAERSPMLGMVASRMNYLSRWDRMTMEDMRWLLREVAKKSRAKSSTNSSSGFVRARSSATALGTTSSAASARFGCRWRSSSETWTRSPRWSRLAACTAPRRASTCCGGR